MNKSTLLSRFAIFLMAFALFSPLVFGSSPSRPEWYELVVLNADGKVEGSHFSHHKPSCTFCGCYFTDAKSGKNKNLYGNLVVFTTKGALVKGAVNIITLDSYELH